MTDPSLFDDGPSDTLVAKAQRIIEARKARDQAMRQAEQASAAAWKAAVVDLILGWPKGREFTGDDVWDAAARLAESTHDPRALGPVLVLLRKGGHIKPTDTYRPSTRKERHAGPVRVWRRA